MTAPPDSLAIVEAFAKRFGAAESQKDQEEAKALFDWLQKDGLGSLQKNLMARLAAVITPVVTVPAKVVAPAKVAVPAKVQFKQTFAKVAAQPVQQVEKVAQVPAIKLKVLLHSTNDTLDKILRIFGLVAVTSNTTVDKFTVLIEKRVQTFTGIKEALGIKVAGEHDNDSTLAQLGVTSQKNALQLTIAKSHFIVLQAKGQERLKLQLPTLTTPAELVQCVRHAFMVTKWERVDFEGVAIYPEGMRPFKEYLYVPNVGTGIDAYLGAPTCTLY